MILLDTHAVVWWASEPDRIPGKARRRIGMALKDGDTLAVSAISMYEVARLALRSRLAFTMPADAWIARLEALPNLRFIPVDNAVARRAATLESLDHGDPIDRIIVATALELGALLVTADRRLRDYKPVKSLWD